MLFKINTFTAQTWVDKIENAGKTTAGKKVESQELSCNCEWKYNIVIPFYFRKGIWEDTHTRTHTHVCVYTHSHLNI